MAQSVDAVVHAVGVDQSEVMVRAAVNRETEASKVRALLAAFFLPAVERQAA